MIRLILKLTGLFIAQYFRAVRTLIGSRMKPGYRYVKCLACSTLLMEMPIPDEPVAYHLICPKCAERNIETHIISIS